eukprot:SAG31_NODE_14221_length_820_cov_0.687933_1_plen_28_part_01
MPDILFATSMLLPLDTVVVVFKKNHHQG